MRGAIHAPTHPGRNRRPWRKAVRGHPSEHLNGREVPSLRNAPLARSTPPVPAEMLEPDTGTLSGFSAGTPQVVRSRGELLPHCYLEARPEATKPRRSAGPEQSGRTDLNPVTAGSQPGGSGGDLRVTR